MKKVSIIMLGYNKLEYTKLAVDSLYKYTSHINFDFISVNNGSSDGTREYFEALPNKIKINFETNVGGDKAFNEALEYCDGEYTVFLNNDLILTENWLDNLIKVMESDPKIGIAVPACNFSSNHQVISANYSNLDELDKFAKEYNKSNPDKWEERLRLVLYAAIFRTKDLKDIGGLDEAYSPGSFDDDDLSYRYRRAGYKLIFAKDTYVHHFGSITMRDQYGGVFARNREIFRTKFGVDSWDASVVDFRIVNNLSYDKMQKVSILGLGKTSGATGVQIKNVMKEKEVKGIRLDYYALHGKYIVDLKTICNNVFYTQESFIDTSFIKNKFDYIYIDECIESFKNVKEVLSALKNILNDSGQMIFILNNKDNNELSIDTLNNILSELNYKKIMEKPEGGGYVFIVTI
ncbi:glycosyltransferase family 2 protein [Clostridium sp. JS66]|uniref:glycosyltransferase family 2 protein n=1 Tax=Clostridium sp. JS66 TaxID=3064705 RepID=UPI00298EA58F|nr:glycosyltransferase family 2 protein [Clostridium sp. JS66]WPC42501.1 glycosyltransferase family 2 protein [Clostridium sp. JS66]